MFQVKKFNNQQNVVKNFRERESIRKYTRQFSQDIVKISEHFNPCRKVPLGTSAEHRKLIFYSKI